MTIFKYGAMSSKYQVKADNKLTAYVAMVVHFDSSAHLIVIYSPEECRKDQWVSFTGQISERLDEIFGSKGSFEKYIEEHTAEINACMKTIKKLV